METEFTITPHETGQRLDLVCVAKLPGYSRAALQKAIKEGNITVNGRREKARYDVREGDHIQVALPEPVREQSHEPQEITLATLYEDKDIVVINKPPGIAAHPEEQTAQPSATVASWFKAHYPDAAHVGENELRPGIVHRLDKDTSGAMVLAKTSQAYENLKRQFMKNHASKEYLALVFGIPSTDDGRINQALIRSKRYPLRRTVVKKAQETHGAIGKRAITEWKIEEKFEKNALLRVFPLTGRMHQIRAHLHWLGFPIVGDTLYTYRRQRPPKGVQRHMLHAEKLTIRLLSGKRKTFTAPLPDDFTTVLKELRN